MLKITEYLNLQSTKQIKKKKKRTIHKETH